MRTVFKSFAALLAAGLTLSACTDNSLPITEAREGARTLVSQVTAFPDRPGAGHEEDDYLYEIAREVPSYGGHFMDENGDLVVWVKNSDNEEAAKRAIRSRIANGRIFVPRSRMATIRIRAQKADYAITELGAWREAVFGIQKELGWTMLDLDEGLNRVTIGVTPGTNYAEGSPFASAIARRGIPNSAVNIVESENSLTLTRRRAWPLTTIKDYADSLVGGVWYRVKNGDGNWSSCTIGYPAILSNGKSGYISAGHCSAVKWNTDGSEARQPSEYITPAVGFELYDKTPGTCPIFWFIGCKYRFADVNIFEVTGRPVKVGYLARPNTRALNYSNDLTVSSSTPLIQVVGETSSITQGSTIDVIGVTSGWSYSVVRNTCTSIIVDFKMHRCSYSIEADIEGGDSGAPVFYYDPVANTAVAAGIVFGRSTNPFITHRGLFSKMMYVRGEIESSGLTFSIVDGVSPPNEAPWAAIQGVTSMQPNASCYWYVTSSVPYTSVTWSVDGEPVGTAWDLTYSASESFLLEVSVTDGTSFAFASKNVTVDSGASTCYIE